MLWSFRIGTLITMPHSRVRILESFTLSRAKRHSLILITGYIGAEDANAAGIGVDGQPAGLKAARVALPDDDLARLHARLLQPLADGQHQRRMGARCPCRPGR